jgi:predicted PurR-regulated permease PerM
MGGLLGAILAVPMTATVKVLLPALRLGAAISRR